MSTSTLNTDQDRLLTPAQVADRLQVGRTTLFKYLALGLPVHRLSPRVMRFDWTEVEEWVRSRCFAQGSAA